MATLTDNQEGLIVGIATATGVAATYINSSALSEEIKLPLSVALGAISVGLLAWWKTRVNVPS